MNNPALESSTGGRCFHITIGTHPSKEVSLEQELRLVKAGLLYADRVKLYSLTASMMRMVLRLGDIAPKQQLEFLQKVIPYITSKKDAKELLAFLRRYKKSLRNKHPSRDELALRAQLQKLVAEQWSNVRKTAIEMEKKAGVDSMDRAVQSGLLELHTFEGTDNDEMVLEFMTDCIAGASQSPLLTHRVSEMSKRNDNMIREFVEGVSRAVSDGSTYPLFDDLTRELVKASIDEEQIAVSESAVHRGRHSGLAGHLLERLPLFDQASVDEILDIRRELDKPLTRFRGAMIKFSEEIKSAYWDEDFSSDAEKVFYRDVKPAILDIEEAVKSNNYLAALLRKFVDKPVVVPAGSVFSVLMSQLSSLPDEVALSLGIGISSAAIVFDAYKDWKQKKQAIEQNHLFFYYQAQKRLSK